MGRVSQLCTARRGGPPTAVSVSGTVEVGGTLTCTATGATSYQWKRAATFGGGGAYSNIGGATSSTYTPVAADVGYDITCDAINAYGTTSASGSLRTPALETYLGSTCKILLDERNQTYSSTNLNTWAAAGSSGASFSGSGHAPQSGRTINGYNAPDFNGSTQYMTQTTGGVDLSSITGAGTHYMTFAVLIADTVPAVATAAYQGAALLSDGGNWCSPATIANVASGGDKMWNWIFDSANKQIGQAISTGSAFLWESKFKSADIHARVGSAAFTNLGSTVNAPGNLTNGLRLGYTGAGTSFFDGAMAFLLHCDDTLTSNQESTVRAWCANKYGVTA